MNNRSVDDPHCPECGEPIGMTAAYCIHCSADLTEDDGNWNDTSKSSAASHASDPTEETTDSGSLLDPNGLLDSLLTAVVGIIGGVVIGLLGWFTITSVLSIGWGFAAGILALLGATMYLVRRQTVQEAVSKAAYGIAIAIMFIPLIVFSSTWDTSNQIIDLSVMVVICAFPAAIVGGIGFLAARFVPNSNSQD